MSLLSNHRTFLSIVLIIIVTLICLCIENNNGLADATNIKKTPIILDEDSWSKMLTGEWMVAFHAPWCPACKALDPEWKLFAQWSDDLGINVALADITTNPGLNGRFMVRGLPTIYHVKDGVFRIYSGSRNHNALIDFIEEQRWKQIEPQSRYWNPDTFHMTFAAYSFRISMKLRDVHDYLVEEIGLPYYVTYLLFALCTISLGAVIGLIIVFIIDQFCPPKTSNYIETQKASNVSKAHSKSSKNKKIDETESDLDEEEEEEEDDGKIRTEDQSSEQVRKRINLSKDKK